MSATRKSPLGSWTIRATGFLLTMAGLAACDSAMDPERLDQEASLLGTNADQARVSDLALSVSHDPQGEEAPKVTLTQVGQVKKPSGLGGTTGATSTSYFDWRYAGYFATVYNTAGSALGGAISTMYVFRGRLYVEKDIRTDIMDFADARLIEVRNRPFLLASGTGSLNGSLDLTSEALFLGSDLIRTTNVFDLPSGWVMGFDFAPGDPSKIVAATAPTGTLSFLDPLDGEGEVTTFLEDQPAFLGLSTSGQEIFVTDVTGSVRAFDTSGSETDTWPLGSGLMVSERAEIGVCSEAMVVGAHTNGVLFGMSEMSVAAEDFGIGASILPDCSAFAATTEGGVVVGLKGSSGYHTYHLLEIDGQPVPYANSVEILRIPRNSLMLGGRWEAGDNGMLLMVISSAEGTHFIQIQTEDQ